ncbi:sigma-54 dependent transcriptional regulator [Gracilinema caldarium]|uniref:sigma-54-dependent transcriptional regulator n=1 Tax=Gracilinema caldarium TaxID=215591 RepID=UPI0026EB9132|nr:sigma-54 dependent transcriptional regulator [Gracilinema caldarium]
MMTILAIDDDPAQLERLALIFKHLQYPHVEYLTAETKQEGLQIAHDQVIDLVFTDLRLPDGDGIEVLNAIKQMNPMIPIVVMTAFSDAREAVEILKQGADDYLVKPTNAEEIEKMVLRIYEKGVLIREAFLPPAEGKESSPASAGIIYQGNKMAQVMQTAARCAESDATIVVSGESGTGKELVARFIHERSLRKNQPFVAVNISALAESLAESELFGHKKGAFTGADTDRIGRFEMANGGTLFIDEIGDIPVAIQVKLLRAIQFGTIERLGENTPRQLNVRIIAATNRNLAALVEQGVFRKDLYYRINVITLELPPLRHRKEDIPVLVEHFINKFNERNHRNVRGLSREAMNALMHHDFPGNVRELENIIERAVVLCRGDIILERDLPPLNKNAPWETVDKTYEQQMAEFERSLIEKALNDAKGNKSAAARALGITERHLRSRLERLYPTG